MATKEYIQDRINNVTTKIEKAKAVIAKKQGWIEKKQAELAKAMDEHEKYWINCDIESLEGDIKSKERELNRELIPSLTKWQNELIKVQSVVRDIPVLVEFLDYWKQKVAEYYRERKDSEERKETKAKIAKALKEYEDYKEAHSHWGWFSNEDERKESYKLYEIYSNLSKNYTEAYHEILTWEATGDFEAAMEKDLQREWEAKYDRLVEDVTREVGTIKDCKGLSVSGRGELNGIVIGENGKAAITTFVAGGWNIQRAHWRCKITKLKNV